MRDKDAYLIMEGLYKEQEPEGTPANPGQEAGMIAQTLQQIYGEFRTLPEQPPAAAYAILQKYMAEPTTATPSAGDEQVPAGHRPMGSTKFPMPPKAGRTTGGVAPFW